MKKRLPRTIYLLVLLLTVVLFTGIVYADTEDETYDDDAYYDDAYYDDEDEDEDEDETTYFYTPVVAGMDVMLEKSDGSLYLNPDLPRGVSYDPSTGTLTLDHCHITADSNVSSYIESYYGDLHIVLKGDNVFDGLSGSNPADGFAFFGIMTQHHDLSITGSGSLTLDFSGVKGSVFGILSNHDITIDGPTVNILGGNTANERPFYGISMEWWQNYYDDPSGKYGEYAIHIKNAKLNISNTCADAYKINIGMDSQDTNLHIENSQVQIVMDGGGAWGIGVGLHDDSEGRTYGGKLSIDDKSLVTIQCLHPHANYVTEDAVYAMYCYDISDIRSGYIYTGDQRATAKLAGSSGAFTKDSVNDRLECKSRFLAFSPAALTQEEPAEPSEPAEPTNPSEPTNPAEPTDPAEPTNPSEPTDPSQPSSPTDPAEPTNPSEPADPTDPAEPTNPTDPSEPTNPTDPDSAEKIDLNTLSYAQLPSATWDGLGEYPCAYCVFLAGSSGVLFEGTDYEVIHLHNEAAGTGTAVLQGIGKYTGTKELSFVIRPRNIAGYETSFRISPTAYVYNGAARMPAFEVNTDDEDFTWPYPGKKDYTVKCSSDRTSIGTHTLRYVFKGNYTGTLSYKFRINPQTVKLSKLKSAKKQMTVKWKSCKGGVKYQIQYRLGKGAWKTKTTGKTSLTVKKLKSKKKYTVRVRAFKKVKGTTYYGAWSNTKTIKIK